jgi:hypothetical protein
VCYPEETRGAAPSLGLINGMGLGRWGSFEQVVTLSRRFARFALITFDVGEGRVPGLALDAAALLGHLGVGSSHGWRPIRCSVGPEGVEIASRGTCQEEEQRT